MAYVQPTLTSNSQAATEGTGRVGNLDEASRLIRAASAFGSSSELDGHGVGAVCTAVTISSVQLLENLALNRVEYGVWSMEHR
jgi:hypothetical protein